MTKTRHVQKRGGFYIGPIHPHYEGVECQICIPAIVKVWRWLWRSK